jgi:hypothetical protein
MAAKVKDESKPSMRNKVSLRWLGFCIALAFSAGLAIEDLVSYRHASAWPLVDVTVLETRSLCQMQYRSSKRWNDDTALPCAEADDFIANHPNDQWKIVPRDFVKIALGGDKAVPDYLFNPRNLSGDELMTGSAFKVHMSPDFQLSAPVEGLLQRERSAYDNQLSLATYLGSILIFLGFHLWQRRRDRASLS